MLNVINQGFSIANSFSDARFTTWSSPLKYKLKATFTRMGMYPVYLKLAFVLLNAAAFCFYKSFEMNI